MKLESIIEPLEDYIEKRIDRIDIISFSYNVRACCADGNLDRFHKKMKPFYKMYWDYSDKLDFTSRRLIQDIAREDRLFSGWASGQNFSSMCNDWATHSNIDEVMRFLETLTLRHFEIANGEEVYEKLLDELNYLSVTGNSASGEIYAMFHAFCTIVLSSYRYDEHKSMLQKLFENWDFMKHFYSVMTGRIIGLGFQNFVSLANNLKTPKYHAHLHLIYWFLSDRFDTMELNKRQLKSVEKVMSILDELMDNTELDHDLDELCQLLFPEEVTEMLSKHPKIPYRQLEKENLILKSENKELRDEQKKLRSDLLLLSAKHEEISRKMAEHLQNAMQNDAIPFSVIEEELLELAPQTVGSVFSMLNDMLGGDAVWQKNFKRLRKRVREREKELSQKKDTGIKFEKAEIKVQSPGNIIGKDVNYDRNYGE